MNLNSIELITPEALLAQRERLVTALKQTDAMLAALGVTGIGPAVAYPGRALGNLDQAKMVCLALESDITAKKAEEWLRANGYPGAKAAVIGIYLAKLARMGELEVTQKGGPGVAAIYQVPKDARKA